MAGESYHGHEFDSKLPHSKIKNDAAWDPKKNVKIDSMHHAVQLQHIFLRESVLDLLFARIYFAEH
jgi:hypothetical protein